MNSNHKSKIVKRILLLILLSGFLLPFGSCYRDIADPEDVFRWSGDWNDPEDTNYKPEYEGKYNPLAGYWKNDKTESRGYYFSDDFYLYDITYYHTGEIVPSLFRPEKYMMNDKAFRFPSSETWAYELTGNKLRITPYPNEDKDWRYYTRVEEE